MPRTAPNLIDVRNIYVDESSQTKHKYLVLGGIIVPAPAVPGLNERIKIARLPELPSGEMKWTKVSRSKLPAYKRTVDIVFSEPHIYGTLDFHAVVIDTHKIKDSQYNNGSRDIGFNKEVYQLLMKFGRLYSRGVFHAYPDRRSTSQSTDDLRLMLNRGIARKGDSREWPFRRLHFRDSDKEPLLQMVDLLIGAIAFKLNGHDKAVDASPAKSELSSYILQQGRVRDVFRDTPRSEKIFSIWHRQLR